MIIEVLAFLLIGAYIATVVIWAMVVSPLKASRSRFVGRLNQKEWQIMHWQLAYNKANNDFMVLSGIYNSTKTESELNDC